MPLIIHRGVNVSHWLSQSKRRGRQRREFFTKLDMELIASYGFDHIRLPIDEEQMWDADGRAECEAFDLLHQALDWARSCGLRVIVDLHILRSHHFLDKNPALYTDPAARDRFAALWAELSEKLREYPVGQVGYELLNEPVAADPADWNAVAASAFEEIRSREPHRVVVIGANDFQQPASFPRLDLPDDPDILPSFHFYHPMLITHYRAQWAEPVKDYAGPVTYPGRPVDPADWNKMPATWQEQARRLELNKPFGPEEMVETIQPVLEKVAGLGLRAYCGEFGCYATTPLEIRRAWLADAVAVFRRFGICWALWDYKGKFGIVDADRQDTGLAEVLLDQ
jgi:endoglucanase